MQRKLWSEIASDDWNDWSWQLSNRIDCLSELKKVMFLSEQQEYSLKKVTATFQMGVTPYYFSLIDFEKIDQDPIFLQAIPSEKELDDWEKGCWDPLNEEMDSPAPGLIHRYPDRVLMVVTNRCATYCRHCNRKRNWQRAEYSMNKGEIDQIISYISRHPELREVILSGGDPFLVSLETLDYILWSIRKIEHIGVIRLGSRIPVTLPQRVTDDLLEVLGKHGPIWVNTHFNHPKEITPEAASACEKLVKTGIPINNQTVLLKNVNDDYRTMLNLNHKLLKIRVRPYYLFQSDPIKGTEHFRTKVAKGVEIIERLQGHTSGLAVPRFAIDAPGGGGKVPILPNYCLSWSPDRWTLRNYKNNIYQYYDPK